MVSVVPRVSRLAHDAGKQFCDIPKSVNTTILVHLTATQFLSWRRIFNLCASDIGDLP